MVVNKYYNKRRFHLKVLDMASYQSNSQDNETTQNPTEHQTSSVIQTGMCLSGACLEPSQISMIELFGENKLWLKAKTLTGSWTL